MKPFFVFPAFILLLFCGCNEQKKESARKNRGLGLQVGSMHVTPSPPSPLNKNIRSQDD